MSNIEKPRNLLKCTTTTATPTMPTTPAATPLIHPDLQAPSFPQPTPPTPPTESNRLNTQYPLTQYKKIIPPPTPNDLYSDLDYGLDSPPSPILRLSGVPRSSPLSNSDREDSPFTLDSHLEPRAHDLDSVLSDIVYADRDRSENLDRIVDLGSPRPDTLPGFLQDCIYADDSKFKLAYQIEDFSKADWTDKINKAHDRWKKLTSPCPQTVLECLRRLKQ